MAARSKGGENGRRKPRKRATAKRRPAAPAPASARDALAPVLVVGIGASAGGLAAAGELLACLPRDAGLCVVLVLHLAPGRKSLVAELLSRPSSLPVEEAKEGQRLQRDRVFVIPPGPNLEVRDGSFHLVPRRTSEAAHSVDHLFRSLAERYGTRSVGIVLSGTASDGADGLREIKAAGGLTIAQTPESAEHDGMPRAAIATGAVDLVLRPAEAGAELARIAARLPGDAIGDLSQPSPELERIFGLLRTAHGVDFAQYKRPTIRRRIQRRMMISKVDGLGRYAALLAEQPDEVRALGEDLLIQVTRFFREPESFAGLARDVVPALLRQRSRNDPVRIWVPGCASGEEAYSVAITLLEELNGLSDDPPLQVFATDVSEKAIERARAGVYPRSIEADVSSERLRRFFVRVEDGYRVSPTVREYCIFARQDLTRDPPFSRLDLVVCRNLLIYLEPPAQQRVIRIFHYALRPSGYLLLGESETVGDEGALFALADKRHKLYRKRPVETPIQFRTDAAARAHAAPLAQRVFGARRADSVSEAARILLERYARPAVVVDADLQIVESLGRTGRYLELASGSASLNLLKMARPGLAVGLRAAIGECRREGAACRRSGLRMDADGAPVRVDVVVTPLGGNDGTFDRFLVAFEEQPPAASTPAAPQASRRGAKKTTRRKSRRPSAESTRLADLQAELDATRGHMQSAIQDLEAANEELQSANEEILSSNEELQSTNEELDTAREELQSTNEEIGTVNEELRSRNEELLRLNSDLENLLNNVQVAIVIVSCDLRVRRFTAAAERFFNLIPSDIGRPIGQIRPNLEIPDLERRIRAAVDNVEPSEEEVRSERGRWLALRVRPYKDVENRIDGAVLSLMDVTLLKEHEIAARSARDFADAIVDAVGDSLLVLDSDLRVVRVNHSFCETFRVSPDETLGSLLYELGSGQWDIPELRRLLEEVLPRDTAIDDYGIERDFPELGRRRMRLNARRIETGSDGPRILLAIRSDPVPAS